MMKGIFKKAAALALAGIMVFAVTACGGSGGSSGGGDEGGLQTFSGDSIEGSLEGVTLSVATSGTYPPFTYFDNDGKTLIGFDMDVLYALQDLLGFEIEGEIQAMDYAPMTSSVAEGKVDIAIAALSMTEERKQVLHFTDPYYTGGKTVIINTETSPEGITCLDDLMSGEYSIAVEKGTSSHVYILEQGVPETAIEIHDSITTAYEALEQGKVDCMVYDTPSFAYYKETKTGTKLDSTGEEFATDDTYGIAISFDVAEENPEIVDIFNKGLEELTANGTYDELKSKWCE